MPRSRDPRKYPPQYRAIIRRAINEGEVKIPINPNEVAPKSVRGYLQAYLLALGDSDPEFGSLPLMLMVRSGPDYIIVSSRAFGSMGQALSEAAKGYMDEDILGANLPTS